MSKSTPKESLEQANARTLAELAVDSQTSENLRVKIIQKLLDNTQHGNFFATLFSEALSAGHCPNCNHYNHWLVPETNLNEMGWLSSDKDKKVVKQTKAKDCPRYQEACRKKKISI